METIELYRENKEYEELKIDFGTDLEDAVDELLYLKNQGKKAFCEFNGVVLDSETVTMDSAFLMITGRTKAEIDLIEKKKQKEKILLDAIDKIPEQIKKGRNLIYPNHFKEWVNDVAMGAIGPTNGKVIDNVLEIMEAIASNRSIGDIVNLYEEQEYKSNERWNKNLVRTYVMKYSKNGYPFYEATHDGDWTLEECEELLNIMYDNEMANKYSSENIDLIDSKQKVLTRIKRITKLEEKSIN